MGRNLKNTGALMLTLTPIQMTWVLLPKATQGILDGETWLPSRMGNI